MKLNAGITAVVQRQRPLPPSPLAKFWLLSENLLLVRKFLSSDAKFEAKTVHFR